MVEYPVENSTAIKHIQHEDETLRVFWLRGAVIDYPDVSSELAKGLDNALDPGRYFIERILPDRKGVAVHERAPFTFSGGDSDD